MIQREFCHFEGAESIRFSHGDFCFVVKSFDYTAGERLARPEIVEQKFSMAAYGAREFLKGFDSRAHCLVAPLVEEFSRPRWGVVLPEDLEVFLEPRFSISLNF